MQRKSTDLKIVNFVLLHLVGLWSFSTIVMAFQDLSLEFCDRKKSCLLVHVICDESGGFLLRALGRGGTLAYSGDLSTRRDLHMQPIA
jgi:hypothetical protein